MVEGGLGKPEDLVAILKWTGWTGADLATPDCSRSMPEERFEEYIEVLMGLRSTTERRLSKRVALAILRKYGGRQAEG